MSAAFRPRRPLALLVLAAALSFPVARVAHADDAAPSAAKSAVERLTADEVEFIRRRKGPEWDRTDVATRERIAENVIRLRSLSPAEREKLVARVKRLEREGGLASAPGRLAVLSKFGAEDRRRAAQGDLFVRAVALVVVRGLPPEHQAIFRSGPRPAPGAPVEALSEVERGAVARGIVERWKKRAVEATAPIPPDPKSPFAALTARIHAAVRAVPETSAPGLSHEARAAAVAEALSRDAVLRPAFDSVTDEVRAAAAKGREGLVEFAMQSSPEHRGPSRARQLFDFLQMVEKGRGVAPPGSPVADRIDALSAALLAELKVSDADAQSFRAARPFERLRLLRSWRARYFGR